MPTDDPEQQPSDEPADEQSSTQSDDAPAENDQPAEQSDEQPTRETDESGQQSEEQAAESDQPIEQSDLIADLAGEQPNTGGGGTGAAGDDTAEDTTAFAGGAAGKTSGRNLKVIATFTQEGDQKFVGDIMIKVFEADNGQQGRFLFPTGGQFWQGTTSKGNVIATPMLRVSTPKVIVWAQT